VVFSPAASGLQSVETRIDYQDISAYLEYAVVPRFSGFVELPYRFLNPEVNANTSGLADMNAGFKFAFILQPDRVATFQFRTWIPTGDAARGLGNNHVSLEPGLLFYQQLGPRFCMEGEFKGWIPVGGTDFAGNLLRYGLGVSYLAVDGPNFRLGPVVECVGWTVLSGQETVAITPTLFDIRDARGETIVNGKIGVRMGIGPRSEFYAGYGRALTGEVMYRDTVRVEYRLTF
jgi:hypothetical protein